MVENQSHNNTCLSANQMDNSGTNHTHACRNKQQLKLLFNDKFLLNCLSVQSSVMERPLTAGVWTRTAGRFLGPDHMMLSNLHVSIFLSGKVKYIYFKVYHGSNFFLHPMSQAFPQWPRPQCAHCPAQM